MAGSSSPEGRTVPKEEEEEEEVSQPATTEEGAVSVARGLVPRETPRVPARVRAVLPLNRSRNSNRRGHDIVADLRARAGEQIRAHRDARPRARHVVKRGFCFF